MSQTDLYNTELSRPVWYSLWNGFIRKIVLASIIDIPSSIDESKNFSKRMHGEEFALRNQISKCVTTQPHQAVELVRNTHNHVTPFGRSLPLLRLSDLAASYTQIWLSFWIVPTRQCCECFVGRKNRRWPKAIWGHRQCLSWHYRWRRRGVVLQSEKKVLIKRFCGQVGGCLHKITQIEALSFYCNCVVNQSGNTRRQCNLHRKVKG